MSTVVKQLKNKLKEVWEPLSHTYSSGRLKLMILGLPSPGPGQLPPWNTCRSVADLNPASFTLLCRPFSLTLSFQTLMFCWRTGQNADCSSVWVFSWLDLDCTFPTGLLYPFRMSHLEAYVIYLPREGDVNFDLLVKVLSGYYTVQLLFFPL